MPAVPKGRSPSLANEILEMSFGLQIKQALDLPRQVQLADLSAVGALGREEQALDHLLEFPHLTARLFTDGISTVG